MSNSWIEPQRQDIDHIPDGCIFLARKLQGSDIWKKPSDWLKIWIYILQEVNHKERKGFRRGENFFNLTDLARDCGIGYWTVINCLQWLKSTKQITTLKTTRGTIIFVLGYDKYQDIQNYKNNTENNMSDNSKTKQKQDGTNTINNNGNNGNNEKNINYRPETNSFCEWLDEQCRKLNIENKTKAKTINIFVERYLGKVTFRPVADHYLAWMVDNNKRVLHSSAIGNAFKRQQDYNKKQELKILEWKQAEKDPYLKIQLKKNGEIKPQIPLQS